MTTGKPIHDEAPHKPMTARIWKGCVHLIANETQYGYACGSVTMTSRCGLTGLLERSTRGMAIDCPKCAELDSRIEYDPKTDCLVEEEPNP